jgi:complement component 1 Q subcomponent-binding protein
VYQELDEKLQQAFEEMLAARGVTPDLGEFLMRLSEDKEQREYMGWLEKVADVVK